MKDIDILLQAISSLETKQNNSRKISLSDNHIIFGVKHAEVNFENITNNQKPFLNTEFGAKKRIKP